MAPSVDRKALRNLSYGLYILTSVDGGKKSGQIINTAIQVTSRPPRVAVIVNKENLTHDTILKSRVFGVSVLDIGTPMTFIGVFGFRSGRNFDKFARVVFMEGVTGCPLVTEHALSVLEAEVTDQVDLGSHTIFIGNVVNSEVLQEGSPLTYEYYHQTLKGKSPPFRSDLRTPELTEIMMTFRPESPVWMWNGCRPTIGIDPENQGIACLRQCRRHLNQCSPHFLWYRAPPW